MSSPRYPGRDLRLQRLGGGDSLGDLLGPVAHVASPLGLAGSASESLAAYRALIDAVFTAPGAAEWLSGLWQKMAALLADQDPAPRRPVARDAIRAANPGPGRA